MKINVDQNTKNVEKTSDQEHGETIRRPDNEHLGTHLRRIYLTTQEAKLNTMHTGRDTFKVKQETLRSRLIHTTWHRSWETMGVVFQERGMWKQLTEMIQRERERGTWWAWENTHESTTQTEEPQNEAQAWEHVNRIETQLHDTGTRTHGPGV